MTYYVPGTEEKDPAKIIRSLQQAHEKTATNTADITALQALPYKIIPFTRVLSVASGNQSITGAGFTPRLVMFQTGIVGVGGVWTSSGQADGTSAGTCIEYQMAGAAFYQSTFAGIQREDAAGTKYQSFVLASFDADGFTLTWTKVSTPTVTASLTATCFR